LIRTPITRIGGKGLVTNWLKGFIPEHVTYCEPFAGSASLLFVKEPSRVEILNDIDSILIEFFKAIKNERDRQDLIKELESMPYSRILWQTIRTRWKEDQKPLEYIKCLSEWFYLNRSTFSGDMRYGGFATPSTTGRNPAQTFRNAVESLEAASERLKYATVECLDYAECIRRYDSENTFFYIDAPYSGSEAYYGDSFAENDHFGLAELLRGIKGRCMVSHYSSVVYDGLYADFNRYEYQSFKGSYKSSGEKKPKTVEAIYCNFEIQKVLTGF